MPAVLDQDSLTPADGRGEIDRALALAALGQHDEARHLLIWILQRSPDDLAALIGLGSLLAETGSIAAACRVFTEAIVRHPDDPAGYVGLAGLLLRANDHATARAHYERALALDPDNALAHQGLGAIFADAGDPVAAAEHFRKGFAGHAVSWRPYRGAGEPMVLLHLVAAGAGNIPTATIVDDSVFQSVVVVADCFDPAMELPPHQLVFNAIGDADRCGPALKAAAVLLRGTRAPVVNPPAAVHATGRAENARRLQGVAGVIAPRTVRMSRATLMGPDVGAELARRGLACPLLLRSPGCHTGRNFVRVEGVEDIATAVTALPGDELLAIEYLDARGADGQARKYRVMMIDGVLYPLHLAISRDWKVHYFTSDMAACADHRAEEAAFLGDMPAVLGPRSLAALARIQDALALDYCGIDFGLNANSDVLVFEANATMVICAPDADPCWTYRRAPVARAAAAVTTMLKRRIARDFVRQGLPQTRMQRS